jgi:hypothetical protein
MNVDRIVRLADIFYAIAVKSEDLPENSDDPETILKNLSKLETFKARVDYAEKNLKHLSSGSSRVIYVLPDKTVLKLAKNDRGVAQNKVESEPGMKSKYINKTLKADKDGVWRISPFLDKITEKEFEKMTGVSFKDFGEALGYGLKSVSDNSDKKKPDDFEDISKLDIYKELVEIGKKYELLPGDLERISSWGQVDDHPIVLDAGLTRDIYDEFYETSSS